MKKSLQDQLLNAGLIDKKKAKKISKENRKAKNVQIKSKDHSISEAQAAAEKAKQEKLAKDKSLNEQRQQQANQKAIAAQIFQLINHYKLDREAGDIEHHFQDNKRVKKLRLTQAMSDEIARGRLCIVRHGINPETESYEIVARPIAEKIQERDASYVVVINKKPQLAQATTTDDVSQDQNQDSDEAYYAQFEIPDDLVW